MHVLQSSRYIILQRLHTLYDIMYIIHVERCNVKFIGNLVIILNSFVVNI